MILRELTPLAPSPWVLQTLGITAVVVIAITFLIGGALIVKGVFASNSDPDHGAELMRRAVPILALAGGGAGVLGIVTNLDTVVPFLQQAMQIGSDSFWSFLGGVATTLVVINVILFVMRSRER